MSRFSVCVQKGSQKARGEKCHESHTACSVKRKNLHFMNSGQEDKYRRRGQELQQR